jgi:hypothetical protein
VDAWPLGRLPFLSDRLLASLRDEAQQQRPGGEPGRLLANLAVSRKLAAALTLAAGVSLEPNLQALYQYHAPRAHIAAHLDRDDNPFVFHLVVDEASAGDRSALVVHGDPAQRLVVASGEGVVLHGSAVRHEWEAMGPSDYRTLATIGFQARSKR